MEASAQRAETPAAKPGKMSSRTKSERKLAWMLCAPAVVGESVADSEARLKEVEDEILQQLHLLAASIARWRASSDESAS